MSLVGAPPAVRMSRNLLELFISIKETSLIFSGILPPWMEFMEIPKPVQLRLTFSEKYLRASEKSKTFGGASRGALLGP